MSRPGPRQSIYLLALGSSLLVSSWLLSAEYFGVPPALFPEKAARYVFAAPLAQLHSGDMDTVAKRTASYWHGAPPQAPASESWQSALSKAGVLFPITYRASQLPSESPPFVFESPTAAHLATFYREQDLANLITNVPDEFSAMLAVAQWVGNAFDHGSDPLTGELGKYDINAIFASGQEGGQYWCEIAALFMTQVATAMAWPARMVTVSNNGYNWDHAVTEIWSNQYRKWILFDTDFNVLYMERGVPLSAFDIIERNHQRATSEVNIVRFGKLKQFFVNRNGSKHLAPTQLKYAHIDMRNDWATRDLARGSPAAGDLATWRTDDGTLGNLLSAMPFIGAQRVFDWPINGLDVYPVGLRLANSRLQVEMGYHSYSPYFDHIEWSVDSKPWVRSKRIQSSSTRRITPKSISAS